MPRISSQILKQPTLKVAQRILGCTLVSESRGVITAGKIVEVEAYRGDIDEACHCYHRRSERNEVMFWSPGHCYVYTIYGIHQCVNVVTEHEGFGAAVLIRALEPVEGLEVMRRRRGLKKQTHEKQLTNGPGKLCAALNINTAHLGEHFLTSKKIWIEAGRKIPDSNIQKATRIGISKSTSLPWRYFIKDHPCVSK